MPLPVTLTDNSRGALFMLGSMTAFTVNDACMKALSDELPLFQALLLRSVAVTAALVILAASKGAFNYSLSRRDKRLIALRSLVEVGAAFFFISALFNMPIANVTAILQALPLTVTLAGAVFLGEAVGWRRLSAILIGFIGVMLIIRPGGEGFTVYSLYVLAAVACVTVRDLAARRMSRDVPSLLVALSAAIAVMLFSALMSLSIDWVPVSPKAGTQLLAASIFVIGGYVFSVAAMRVGEIGFVAPFRYSSLLVALVLGFLVFREWPDVLTLLGSGIVVATGLFTLFRETQLAKVRRGR
ncbi:MAG: DMT family transporter [Litoreibacter sp.]|nr:DMT family transporter [Litoreibacter sp.]